VVGVQGAKPLEEDKFLKIKGAFSLNPISKKPRSVNGSAWIGHTLRRPVDNIVKHTLNWNLQEKKSWMTETDVKISRQRGEGRRNDMGTTEEDSPEQGAVEKPCCSPLLPEELTGIRQ
jgi:hypothetical protein